MKNNNEISHLEKVIDQADIDYYNFDDSDLTDEEYDKLRDRLYQLDPKNSRFKNGNQRSSVGSKPPGTSTKIYQSVMVLKRSDGPKIGPIRTPLTSDATP